MHATTGRWQLGLALALTTAVFWGLLPIALKVTLTGMDAWTLTWYRFTSAAIALGRRGAASPAPGSRVTPASPRTPGRPRP